MREDARRDGGKDPEGMAGTPPGGRKPYVPPSVETEPVFETTSLACGKTTASFNDFSCNPGHGGDPKNS